jgi:hypothetical protein
VVTPAGMSTVAVSEIPTVAVSATMIVRTFPLE